MTIQTIQLNKLALSDLNVRKVKPKEIEALAADIQARGVLQNLIGYDEDGKIKICAGGRRYRALKLLQKAKTIPGTFEVPVEIRSKDEALELAFGKDAQIETVPVFISEEQAAAIEKSAQVKLDSNLFSFFTFNSQPIIAVNNIVASPTIAFVVKIIKQRLTIRSRTILIYFTILYIK